jgi:ribosomal protein L21
MGIKLGDISPLAGAISGKGMFGKGLAKLADSGAGMLVPMSYLAKSQRDKNARRAAMEVEMQKKGAGTRGRPMVEDVMVAEQVPAMKKGGKVSAAQAVHKHERAKHKGQPLTKMAKGGSTASKRADGCATKGKTKGRFV